MLRRFIVTIPPLLTCILVFAFHFAGRFAVEYVVPLVHLMEWTPGKGEREITYYHRRCDTQDQSTLDARDLVVDTTKGPEDAMELMLKHGAAVFPSLLPLDISNALRNYILKENAKMKDTIFVLSNEHRWSFFLQVDQDPTVSDAIEYLLNNNPLFTSAMQLIAGNDPAIIEFTTITVAYGAGPQHWHQDVTPESNGAKYSRNFIPSYSLFIPLQDTTAEMGATGVCPGTHMCAGGCGRFCAKTGFQMSDAGGNSTTSYWPSGWGALVNQQTTHVGTAHTDPGAPHRVVFIITFAPRPNWSKQRIETKMIGLGGSYSLHWSQWGHTMADFANPRSMRQPWRSLKSLGLHKSASSVWGWDYITQATGRLANSEVGFHLESLDEFLDKGGFWLPAFLKVDKGKYEDGYMQESDRQTWLRFLHDSFTVCRIFLWKIHATVMGCYLVALVRGKKKSTVGIFILWLLASHMLVYTFGYILYLKMERGVWATNIRLKKLFQAPIGRHLSRLLSRSTLPSLNDVLDVGEMRSVEMASFNDVLDRSHPGNVKMIALVAHFSGGYLSLSSSLKDMLLDRIVALVSSEGARFLTKNIDGNWAFSNHQGFRHNLHQRLLSRHTGMYDVLLRALQYMLSESRYGIFRNTALQQRHTPRLLSHLGSKISLAPVRKMKARGQHQRSQFGKPHLMTERKLHSGDVTEDSVAARLKEGDVVEAAFEGNFDGKHYFPFHASGALILILIYRMVSWPNCYSKRRSEHLVC